MTPTDPAPPQTRNPPGSGSGLGFCRAYSFNTGDLVTSGDVLINYLAAYKDVPWDDLRYMFGEVGRGVNKQRRTAARSLAALALRGAR
jgi:hypothetical protein